jgi:hypothetical protein
MAYMRGHFYIWGDGENVHFWHGNHVFDGEPIKGQINGPEGRPEDNTLCQYPQDYAHGVGPTGGDGGSGIALPNYIVEEFCVMYWSRMSDEERADAVKRVIDKYGGGNFGADAVMEAAKLPTVMDVVMQSIEEGGEE